MVDPNRAKSIFLAVTEKPAAERTAFLDQAAGGDAALRARVEALLQAHDDPDSFLEAQAVVGPTMDHIPPAPLAEHVGTLIGPYKLLEQIGEGGMGVVYMADQQAPVRRRVALKIIKTGMDTRQVIARFEAERQALALMDHTNIARVLDAGATDSGRPYFVMELVRGISITEYCDQNNLPVQERLELFVQVCHAVQHAHQKGIIHRDIKPTNVLVTLNDGRPVPKVIDFGVAKATNQQLTEKTLFTAFAQMVGTPLYMSPEQAEMSGLDIDTRSDIYSLGVLLYELLTGTTPFDQQRMRAAAYDEMRRIIREEEPPRPSTRISTTGEACTAIAAHRHVDSRRLSQLVQGDLDWIVMKALEKDRQRRYETASSLVHDIQRHLADQPVEARPPSNLYRFRKLIRRNKLAFTATSAVTVSLILGAGVSTWMFLREKDAHQRAVAAEYEQIHLREEAQQAQADEAKLRLQAESDEKRAQSESAKSRQVAEFLKEMFHGPTPWSARGRDTEVLREIMDRAADRIGTDLTEQPDVEAELRCVMGHTYWSINELKKSETMFRRAVELYRKSLGDEHLLVADSLRGLALSLRDQSHRSAAEAALREALAIQRKLLGSESSEVSHTLRDLGLVLWAQHKLPEAESVEREALALRRKLYGSEHKDIADSLNRLADVLIAEGQYAEAEALTREAVAMLRKLLHNSPDTLFATTLQTLASVLQDEGHLPDAEAAARKSVAMMSKVAGTGSSWMVPPLHCLMVILSEEGKSEELEQVFNEYPIPSVGRAAYRAELLRSRAVLLRDRGNLADAENLFREALALSTKELGKTSPESTESFNGLIDVLKRQGKTAEVEKRGHEAEKLLNGNPAADTETAPPD